MAATWIAHARLAPRLTDQRGHYTRQRTTPTFVAPDGWTPATKTRPLQLTPEIMEYWVDDTGAFLGAVMKPGKRQLQVSLPGLADEYDRIMTTLNAILEMPCVQEGWESLDDPAASQCYEQLRPAFSPDYPAAVDASDDPGGDPTPEAPGWWRFKQEQLALAILGELYQLNPKYLQTTLLPKAACVAPGLNSGFGSSSISLANIPATSNNATPKTTLSIRIDPGRPHRGHPRYVQPSSHPKYQRYRRPFFF